MTSFEPRLSPPDLPAPSADRKDVLGVSRGALSGAAFAAANGCVEQDLQQLHTLGFQVSQPGPRHWVLTPSGAPTVIHLYGATELARFVETRAQQYTTLYSARHSV
ncbi:hypothetical protein [Marinobacter mobilis]|uniref:Uncharacterized protein n=1 Tax=Marinobacter mobilis TaxID=488533 RepID=A0A1H2ZTI5_9GAMM|nr:hypothetical protein [Marinobacter mobilis]SDX20617.1 hypothetical protein SAMN04487960_10759 [Marinobacter mobilis]